MPIDTVISSGIIPFLVEGVKSNSSKIQLECVWILSNLATGNEEQVTLWIKTNPIDARSDVFRNCSHLIESTGVLQ